ncbi:MAG: hypothetical protein AAGA99_01875 [Actinomycetota bacterium]
MPTDADPMGSAGPVLQRAGDVAAKAADWGASALRTAGIGWGVLAALVGIVLGRWWIGLLVGVLLVFVGWSAGRGLRSWASDVRAETSEGATAIRERIGDASMSVADGVQSASELISSRLKGRGRLRSLWGLRKLATELPGDVDDVLGALSPTRLGALLPRLSLAAWAAVSVALLIVIGPLVLAIALAVA